MYVYSAKGARAAAASASASAGTEAHDALLVTSKASKLSALFLSSDAAAPRAAAASASAGTETQDAARAMGRPAAPPAAGDAYHADACVCVC
jgi:hypothetical protein